MLKAKTEELLDRIERHIYREAIQFIEHVLKTNYFIPTKTGLAFRLNPDLLNKRHYPNKPMGIFFITGREYRFFQVRWQDVARGGLRIILPNNNVDHRFAIAGLFDEVYGLSHAQQLKNKDIPEGGSKAVMVLKPNGNKERAVKGGINALLDLLVSEDEIHEQDTAYLINYYNKEEIIYLGPDENMNDELIGWVPKQAERRGYRYAKAFISSKPKTGINHKRYGVTSEGLHVFLHQALIYLNIWPTTEKFTIKMTGGPNGDVAGNELKIIYREYGEKARIVAIADGLGAAYDPEGLNWQELQRLQTSNLAITEFQTDLLSGPEAYVIKADTAENIRKRNELHSIVTADIFIPAGGRPYTVNLENAAKFITDTGPTCKAIIEGANIFFTSEARTFLQDQGILIIKDSSANKTGVICSSFEIIASLILDDDEFIEIKDEYIQQVVEILRDKALIEANLLFQEYDRHHGKRHLSELSMDISREINQITDALLARFNTDMDKILNDKFFQQLILQYCPKILADKYHDRLLDKLPPAHRIAILASSIASQIVYREGLSWLAAIDTNKHYHAAISYIKNLQLSQELIENITTSDLKDKDNITAVLRRSAARDLTLLALRKN